MTTILIRKGLNSFRYSACGEKGNFLFNSNQIGRITANWSKERKNNTVQFIRQLHLLPESETFMAAGMESIGKRLIEARNAYGFTQMETAKMMGIPVKTYGQIERDEAFISKHKIIILAVRLRINYDWLLYGKGSMKLEAGHE